MKPSSAALALALFIAPYLSFAQTPPPARPVARPAVAPPRATPEPTAPTPAGVDSALRFAQTFSDVADRVLPSVVAIFVEMPRRDDAMLYNPNGFWGMPPDAQAPTRHGAGSGVVIRSEGAILTNNHVVEGATRIRVRLSDGRMLSARLLGADPATDLAVIQVEAQGLTPARLGDSDAARVGEWVLAIGAPFGLEATVTHGVLSAKGRGGIGVNQIEDYLQTDASINPGNSGGALVNLRGEVLGINTMVVGRGQGIGFAVPSRIAQLVAGQIVRTGHVTRGWIGIGTQDITPDLESAFGGGTRAGVIVNQLAPNGPASRGGLRVGDLITSINGREVHVEQDVVREIAQRGVGERLAVGVLRGTVHSEVTVTTSSRPGEAPPPAAPPPPAADPNASGFGIVIDALPDGMAQARGIPTGTGVVIVRVAPNGGADRAGLRAGDVILQADGRDVHGPDDVVAAARDGDTVFLVRRGDVQEFVGLHTRPAR